MRILDYAAWAPSPTADRDPATEAAVSRIVAEVRAGRGDALRHWAKQWDGLAPEASVVVSQDELKQAWEVASPRAKQVLSMTAHRIRVFAEWQREALGEFAAPLGAFRVGQRRIPIERAGAYVPGGRFPLPSTALMTVIPAKVAGVDHVVMCSPKPHPLTLAAAWLAGADTVLRVGGAQAIAAMALGVECPPCDIVVGPGNRYVTAAKRHVQALGLCAIDMAAGPSELCVLADDFADPSIIAADLLAQAEHDPDARPLAVVFSTSLAHAVRDAVHGQLVDLPTAETARVSVADHGTIVVVRDTHEALACVNRMAPEHLQIDVADTEMRENLLNGIRNAGAIFIGREAAEVFGDYGAGPNHTLPTGGVARYRGGLSVYDFLKVVTFMDAHDIDTDTEQLAQAEWLARQEGLIGHARAAAARQPPPNDRRD